ncbi:MAG: glycosyl hydrolase [bacterium]|nr:glycosyl hydrolase [bacterium]
MNTVGVRKAVRGTADSTLRSEVARLIGLMLWAAIGAGVPAAAAAAGAGEAGREGLRPTDPSGFFVTPERPATLEWRYAPPPDSSREPGGGLSYAITDYEGKQVGSGQAAIGPDGGVSAVVTLDPGFYEIVFAKTGERFGVAAVAPPPGAPDPFFCIDAGLSWLAPPESWPGLVKALRRVGVAMARERFNLGSMRPWPNRWNERALAHNSEVRRIYTAQGVPILELSHDAPYWMRLENIPEKIDDVRKLTEEADQNRYPQKLAAYEQIMADLAGRWRDSWGALEGWNEPDIKFGAYLPADQYVPLVKALAYMLQETGTRVPMVGGVFTGIQPVDYMTGCARNGLLDVVDAVSFHFYGPAAHMEELVEKHRSWLAANRKHGMPLWITECGKPWEKGPARPPRTQAADSALDITMKAVESRACGVARFFAFVYPYYEEGAKNFGMMGKEMTPTALMGAYAECLRRLSGTRYLGDLKTDDGRIMRARVFAPAGASGSGSATVVLYTGKVREGATVKAGLQPQAIHGIDGRELASAADGSVPIPDGLAYLTVDRAALAERLITETSAMKLNRLAQPVWPPRGPVDPIVLQPMVDLAKVQARPTGYQLAVDSQSKIRLGVHIANLSAERRELRISYLWMGEGGPGTEPVPLNGQPVTVSVEPRSTSDIWSGLDLAGKLASDHMRWLEVRAQSAGQEAPVSRLAMQLKIEPTLDSLLGLFGEKVPLSLGPVENWQPAMPAGGRMKMDVTDESWKMAVTFGKGDKWAYPRFALPAGVDLSKYEGIVARVRLESSGDARLMLFEQNPAGTYGYYTAGGIGTGDGRWHAVYIPFASLDKLSNMAEPEGSLDLDKVHSLSFGINTERRENMLQVSDVCLVGGRK